MDRPGGRSRSRSRSPTSRRIAAMEQHGRLVEMFARISMVIKTIEAVCFLLRQMGDHCDDPSLDDRFSEWSASGVRMMNIARDISADAERIRRDILVGLTRWGQRQLDNDQELPIMGDHSHSPFELVDNSAHPSPSESRNLTNDAADTGATS